MVRSSACCGGLGRAQPHVVGAVVQVQLGVDARPSTSAACSRSLCTHGMSRSASAVQQQERRGAGARRGVIGLAWAARSGTLGAGRAEQLRLAGRRRPPGRRRGRSATAAMSLGAYQAATADDRARRPGDADVALERRRRPPVRPSSSARWPPADSPQAAIRSGSMPSSSARARSQRTAAFASCSWAGQVASPESR